MSIDVAMTSSNHTITLQFTFFLFTTFSTCLKSFGEIMKKTIFTIFIILIVIGIVLSAKEDNKEKNKSKKDGDRRKFEKNVENNENIKKTKLDELREKRKPIEPVKDIKDGPTRKEKAERGPQTARNEKFKENERKDPRDLAEKLEEPQLIDTKRASEVDEMITSEIAVVFTRINCMFVFYFLFFI